MSLDRTVRPTDSYAEQLTKLIPAEIVAAFLSINSVIPQREDAALWVWVSFVVLVGACILYLRMQGVKNWWQTIFTSCIAFPIWAAGVAAERVAFLADQRYLPGVAVILATLLAPLFVSSRKPEPVAQPAG